MIIADVMRGESVFSLIEFEWRVGEAFKLAIISLSNGRRINDGLMEVILRLLSKKEGRWESVEPRPNGVKIVTLKHTWSSVEGFADTVCDRLMADD